MTELCCWMRVANDAADGDELATWVLAPTGKYLTVHGEATVLRVSPGERGSVNGLRVVAGIQVVEPGDIVYLYRQDAEAIRFVVAGAQPVREPGAGRVCQLTGIGIQGEAIRCRCGAIFSGDVPLHFQKCPVCDHTFETRESQPPEELL